MSDVPVPVALTVAAHDPLGGAGVAADLATFAALGSHGMVTLTAVTAQRLGSVDRVEPVPAPLVSAQLDGILADFHPTALKTGFLGSGAVVREVAQRIAATALPMAVVDPVLVDGRGNRLPGADLEPAYRSELFPRAAALTPNLAEAALLVGRPLATIADVLSAATELAALGAELVVVTGGAVRGESAVDVVIAPDGSATTVSGPWVDHPHVRGSGCTFAAALAVHLGAGLDSLEAVERAKRFVAARLADTAWPGVGGTGPVAHWIRSAAQGTSDHSSP